MFKKSLKSVDTARGIYDSGFTHGKHKLQKQMRTKALLCAALVAAGAISAVAQQNVYSLNIVGYVNVTVPSGYSLLANPLSAGVTNGANEIMTPIDGEQILTWTGSGYSYVAYDSGSWVDSQFNPAQAPSLPPGKGFFFFNPFASTTVTFVGQVVPGPGVTNSLAIPSGYSLIGSPLPASVTDITAAPVSLPKIDGMQILKWTGAGYSYAAYDSGAWVDSQFNTIPAPGLNVGQGFFLFNPFAATTWPQSLP